jgi:hypothetical protein
MALESNTHLPSYSIANILLFGFTLGREQPLLGLAFGENKT